MARCDTAAGDVEADAAADADMAVGVCCAVSRSKLVSVSGSLLERASGPVGDGCGESETPSKDDDSCEWDSDEDVEAVDDWKAGDSGLGNGDVRGGGRE